MAHDDDLDNPSAKPSWQERETNLALLRLANARANLAGLEEQAAGPAAAFADADPADLALVESIEGELATLRVKAGARFGGGAARDRIVDLEFKQRLAFERIGVTSFEQYVERRDAPPVVIDADVLAFARREFEDAQQAFLDISSLEMPEREAGQDDHAFDELDADDDGEDAEIINLNVKPAAS